MAQIQEIILDNTLCTCGCGEPITKRFAEPEILCKNCGHGIETQYGNYYHIGVTNNIIAYRQKLCWFGGCKNNKNDCDCIKPEPNPTFSINCEDKS